MVFAWGVFLVCRTLFVHRCESDCELQRWQAGRKGVGPTMPLIRGVRLTNIVGFRVRANSASIAGTSYTEPTRCHSLASFVRRANILFVRSIGGTVSGACPIACGAQSGGVLCTKTAQFVECQVGSLSRTTQVLDYIICFVFVLRAQNRCPGTEVSKCYCSAGDRFAFA
jgi:hypothetical protein